MDQGALILWYALTAGSLLFVIWDLFTNTPTTGVMKLAWILVILYTGPIGLFIYFLSCRQALPETHDQFIAPLWKQGVGSLMHCMSGDATGIIIAAVIVYHFGLPNGIDLILEYCAGFICGLLIFQALFMMPMYDNNYFKAVKKTFFAEFVSMNMLMTGMFPVMVLMMHYIPDGDNPWTLTFWGIMSIAIIAGGITAFPINLWMVSRNIKHGMLTPGSQMSGMSPQGEGHKMSGMSKHGEGHEMSGMSPQGEGHKMSGMSKHGEGHRSSHDDHKHPLTYTQQAGIIIVTFALLIFVLWIVSFFAPIIFS